MGTITTMPRGASATKSTRIAWRTWVIPLFVSRRTRTGTRRLPGTRIFLGGVYEFRGWFACQGARERVGGAAGVGRADVDPAAAGGQRGRGHRYLYTAGAGGPCHFRPARPGPARRRALVPPAAGCRAAGFPFQRPARSLAPAHSSP